MSGKAPGASEVMGAREVGEQLVRQAGALMMERFRGPLQVDVKGRGNVVTEVDFAVESLVVNGLRQAFPDWGIRSEESPYEAVESEYLWILDPLDGSMNFSHGLPIFAVNLALAFRSEVVLGLTYDPTRDELFSGVLGEGAYLNGTRLAVAARGSVQESVLGFGIAYDNDLARQTLRFIEGIWPGVQSLRDIGSAALGLAYVAAGRLDLYIHNMTWPWDYAAGVVLVGEAGGLVTERNGSGVTLERQGLVAGNPAVHRDLLRLAQVHGWGTVPDRGDLSGG